MSEEIEIKVRHFEEDDEAATSDNPDASPLVDLMRRLLLASIGAVAITYEEAERTINRLVERGEIAQRDGENLLQIVIERMNQGSKQFNQQVSTIGEHLGSSLDQALKNLSIPTRRDIDELSRKIAHLTDRIEELRRSRA
ncbi:MAG: poly(hydroxyalkanoate) granule-associated protein [Chloroflexaceae bacterium]|nr:poly(hydroxyalkanoate) granule-associated protein [Chloroflexaceae bacterium]